MNIPRYWKQVCKQVDGIEVTGHSSFCNKAGQATIYAWGYSDISIDEALIRANARVDEIVEAMQDGENSEFYYPLNALHEDIVYTLKGTNSDAVITRNRYFAQVLNSADMMFVDIDVPDDNLKKPSIWQRLLGRSQQVELQNQAIIEQRIEQALDRVVQYAANHPQAGFLVYRTFAGLRLIATHQTFDPKSTEVQQCFDGLGADPLYQRLCYAQGSFRARLTPKFWRMDHTLGQAPQIKYHISKDVVANWQAEDAERVQYYQKWLKQYEAAHKAYATCRFIKHLGNSQIAEVLKEQISYHDRVTQARSNKPLA